MTGNDKFTLYVYDGDFGLSSLNVDCTQSILYTAMAKVPIQLKLLDNVKCCTFYNGPTFIHKNISFKTFGDTVLYLRTLNYTLDSNLTAKQKSETLAITNLVQSKLRIVVEYVFWVDQRNCDEFSRIWFIKALPVPFNYFYVKKSKEKAVMLIESIYCHDFMMDSIRDHLTTTATECLSSLSTRLGTANFFYGDSPTTLDVVIYSYIAPLLKLPFPSNTISTLVVLWPNLVNFVKRIDAQYLPEMPKESKYLKNEEANRPSDEDVSYVAISILTVSAMSLMLGFAFSRGFISSKMFY